MSRWDRWIVGSAVGITFVLLAGMAVDAWWRAGSADRSALSWADRLDVTVPVFWPAGTPQRQPESLRPGIDLRFSPWMPINFHLLTPEQEKPCAQRGEAQ